MSSSIAQGNPRLGSPRSREEKALLLLLGVGAALLLASLFVGWYQVQEVARNGCTGISESLSPFWVSVSTTGSGCPPTETGSFTAAGLAQTGALYSVAGALTAIACVLAFSLLGLKWSKRQSRRTSLFLLAVSIAALALGALAPALIVTEQPATICRDEGVMNTPFEIPGTASSGENPGIYLNQNQPVAPPRCDGWAFWTGNSYGWSWIGTSGPWNSFAGSNVSGSAVLSWAPSLGWVLDLGGVVLLIAGPVLSRRASPSA
jgi:hypothetical protein